MQPKHLTKALHTVRVVERIAAHLVKDNGAGTYNSSTLLYAVVDLLGNTLPQADALYDACKAACARVLA